MKVNNLQTVLDIALITTGDAALAFDIAMSNNVSLTDKVAELEVNEELNKITQFYKLNGIAPATDFIEETYKIFDYTFDETFE
jgi:hypothetical protein